MAKQLPIEIFMPPNMLKAKIGGSFAGIEPLLIIRADAAMEELKSEFTSWLASDIARLVDARDGFAALCDPKTKAELFRTVHDLRGGAETYEFPLISRIATSLAVLLDGVSDSTNIPLSLVDAHVDAVRVLFRDNVRDPSNQTATLLCEELSARVTEAIEHAK